MADKKKQLPRRKMPKHLLDIAASMRAQGPEDERPCTCGHTRDEHGGNGSCTVEDCDCAGFEPEGD